MIKSFKDIPKFPQICYSIDLAWNDVEGWINRQNHEKDELSGLNLNPDFQRGHVWNTEQQTAYIEFILSGGTSGRHLYFNHPGWMSSFKGDFVLVDGLQRLTAVRKFLNNEVSAFGLLFNQFEGHLSDEAGFVVNIAKIQDHKDVLKWYILMNSGGTPHSTSEIERVKSLIKNG